MSAQHAERPTAAQHVWPAKTLPSIVGVLTGDVDAAVRNEFCSAMDCAWTAARLGDTLQPLLDLVEAWWPQAVFWSEPQDARRILADAEDIQRNGLGDRPRRPF